MSIFPDKRNSAFFFVDLNGSFGVTFANAVNRFELISNKSLNGRLPITASINGIEQSIYIILENSGLKIDFDVCSIKNVVMPMLAKLGAFSMSPSSILGRSQGFGKYYVILLVIIHFLL